MARRLTSCTPAPTQDGFKHTTAATANCLLTACVTDTLESTLEGVGGALLVVWARVAVVAVLISAQLGADVDFIGWAALPESPGRCVGLAIEVGVGGVVDTHVGLRASDGVARIVQEALGVDDTGEVAACLAAHSCRQRENSA